MPLMQHLHARRAIRMIVRRVGHRGAALLFFALLDAVYAFSLFNPQSNAGSSAQLAFMRDILPLQGWGAMWAAAGVTCFVSAFRLKDRWGFTAAMIVKVMWGAMYICSAIVGVERAYLGAVIWLCLAGWVGIISSWPEPPELPAKE